MNGDGEDVTIRRLETAIGGLLLSATDAGLVHVGFDVEGEDAVRERLEREVGPVVTGSNGTLDDAARQIEEYLSGARRRFDVPLDTRLARGFRGEVQRRLAEVGYGATVTYSGLAELAGRPAAVRAVGTACATNPLPLLWPCHRVLRSDGGLGGYRGGTGVKVALLELEAAHRTA